MREDMAKVIVERPRFGGGVRFPRTTAAVRDDLPLEESWKRQGMRRPWNWTPSRKMLNENLAPLVRYLRSNVGRPWNKVYSEVCQRINRNSAVQMHVWQHLMWEVCTDPHLVPQMLQGRVGRWPWSFRQYRFYVDPKTGLLRENPKYRQRFSHEAKPAERLDRVSIDAGREYRLLEGIWYEIELAPLPVGAQVYDMAMRQRSSEISPEERARFYGGRPVYAVKKRQLNKREIRNLADITERRKP